MDEEQQWIQGFMQGDDAGFERLVLKYRRSAIAFGQQYVRDYYAAEDIAQESFAEIYVHRSRFNPKYRFKPYLFTIIRNKCVDHVRKLTRFKHVELDTGIPVARTTEEVVLNREKRSVIQSKLLLLHEDYRTAIHLIDVEQFSYKEAAAIMGKNLMQMKILIYRARQKMKRHLEQEE
ncbi:RNA polymerase sigma factor [Paenibacillus sp. MBLB4367]|uniref:RNA polymerase sigma factor n=1 Tax=Paenibacillus sp. MBLB4367 TaxID=3384767 RepID=UPI003907EA87